MSLSPTTSTRKQIYRESLPAQTIAGFTTFEEIVELKYRDKKHVANNSRRQYLNAASNITKFSGLQYIEDFKPEHCRIVCNKLFNYCKDNDLDHYTFKQYWQAMGHLQHATGEDVIQINPWNKNEATNKSLKDAHGSKQIIKVNDIRPADKFFDPVTITHAAYHSRHAVCWWIMRYTLTHVSEAEGIMWGDIDFDNNTIGIQLNKMRPLKTNSRRRVLPMVEPLREVLDKWRELSKIYVGCIFGKYYKDPGSIMRRHMQQIKG